MEEKMRRQKEKGKSETTESQSVEPTNQHKDDEADENDEDEISSTIVNAPQEPTIDDEGQSHNIDNAVQYDNEPSELSRTNEDRDSDDNYSSSTATSIPTTKYTTTTNANKAGHQHRRHPTPSNVKSKIEFEKIEVIEIKSDGSTGHLVPGHYEE